MKLDEIKQQIEYRDSLKWVQTQLKRFSASNVKQLDKKLNEINSELNNYEKLLK